MKNKKKILFVIHNMNVGGAEKALISLLNELDYTKFEVDLQLFKQVGMFLTDIPKDVNLLPAPKNYDYFDGSYKEVFKTLNPRLIFNRYRFGKIRKKSKSPGEREQLSWKFLKGAISSLPKEYDVAIGYLENMPIYFVIDKVRANKKIGFIHNDYRNIKNNPALDQYYFDRLNNICSVSTHCVEILKETFPHFSKKIKLIPNIISEQLILHKAEDIVTEVKMNTEMFNIVSIGRLAKQKGFDLAIDVARILKEKGFRFKWFVLGEGILRSKLEKKIKRCNLEDSFFLLGNHQNPYKFMKKANLIVQTSVYEGKSIAIDEAKLLNKIILVTNYPTAKDQIDDKYEGFICDFSASQIAGRIMSLVDDNSLTEHIVKNLKDRKRKEENKILELL